MILHETPNIRVQIGASETHVLDALGRALNSTNRLTSTASALLTVAELHPKVNESPMGEKLRKLTRVAGAAGVVVGAALTVCEAAGISKDGDTLSRHTAETPSSGNLVPPNSDDEISLDELRDTILSQ